MKNPWLKGLRTRVKRGPNNFFEISITLGVRLDRSARQIYELFFFNFFVGACSDVIKRQTTFSFVSAAVLAIKMSFEPSASK